MLGSMTRKISILIVAVALAGACASKSKKDTTTSKVTEVPTPAAESETNEAPEEVRPSEVAAADLVKAIYFEFDSAVLGNDARHTLDNNAEWLKENPAREIVIEGHTDEQGTTEYNIGLGDRRARAAKDYLLALGVDDNRVRIVSYGEEKPAMPGVDDKNRRSIFVVER